MRRKRLLLLLALSLLLSPCSYISYAQAPVAAETVTMQRTQYEKLQEYSKQSADAVRSAGEQIKSAGEQLDRSISRVDRAAESADRVQKRIDENSRTIAECRDLIKDSRRQKN